MLRTLIALAAVAAVAAVAIGLPALAADGVQIGQPSAMRNLVPAGGLEKQAAQQYDQIKRQAASRQALGPDDHPQVKRLRAIAARMIPFAGRFNPRAAKWQWEVNLIGSKQINAFCMPGGKIAFYTGLLDTLKLSDDEVAMVMGHEIAHALREHARERLAKNQMTQIGASLLGELVGGGRYTGAFQMGGNLLSMKFSRDDESEADVAGLDLAARAGFDPRAAVSLWHKMTAANSRAPLEFFSTHPAGENRIREIEKHLPAVMPLYLKARQAR
jgi:Zn-dependent protease with chaperone function